MAKYRKKPVVIEAVQWNGKNTEEIEEFYGGYMGKYKSVDIPDVGSATLTDKSFNINTLEGTMIASVGDYIIKGVNGEFYPCKPDIFEKTYDAVIE
jgi:hypothetical protein